MESVGATNVEVRYHINARIKSIEWHNQPDGFFVHFDGSWEAINLGIEHPPWSVGDIIHITLMKEP